MEMVRMKAKKTVKKKMRKKSVGQTATQKIGQPGIGLFQLGQLYAAEYNPRVIDPVALQGLTNSIFVAEGQGKQNAFKGRIG